jgi:hypothetical protein
MSDRTWNRRIILAILAFEAVGSFIGGPMLMAAPDGHLMKIPVADLHGAFPDFFVPGLLLTALGILNAVAFFALLKRCASAWLWVGASLGGFLTWFIVELAIVGAKSWAQAVWGIPVVIGLLALAPLARWSLKFWGSRADERERSYPGDDVVSGCNYWAMMAIDVHASPEAIWPWLMQLGRGRGGLYSYDWLDRLFGFLDAPSAQVLLPGTHQLELGDGVPFGKNPNSVYRVRVVEANRALVLYLEDQRLGYQWSWGFILVREGAKTRLLSRSRYHLSRWLRPVWVAMELPAFIMTRKMLLNLRDRAEASGVVDHPFTPNRLPIS